MWLSEKSASVLYNLANMGLIFSLVVGVVSTAFVVWTGNIKEKYLQTDLATTNERAGKANERAANLEVEALSLRMELIKQGPRSGLLYGERRRLFVEQLRQFSGQKVEIRYCRIAFNQHFVDNDTMGLAMLLQAILQNEAGWSLNPLAKANCSGTAISIEVASHAGDSTRKAAEALLSALSRVPLTVIGPAVGVSDAPRPAQDPIYDAISGKEVPFRPLDADTIVITVLAHP